MLDSIHSTCPELVRVTQGIGQAEGDAEGRVLTAELDVAYVVTVYTPNSGEGLRRLGFRTGAWDRAFGDYVKLLERTKPVLVIGTYVRSRGETPPNILQVLSTIECAEGSRHPRRAAPEAHCPLFDSCWLCRAGDLNVAHKDVDFFNPQEQRTLKQAGTTLQERASFAENLLGARQSFSPAEEGRQLPTNDPGCTLIDTFRFAYPSAGGVFSYWSMRAGNRRYNRGMRLDYCLASDALIFPERGCLPRLHDAFVLDADTIGISDHCPVGCVLRL